MLDLKPFALTLALAAGFLGGSLSHYLWPAPVQAQAQTPKELRAQSFILEGPDGKTLGVFSMELPRPGRPDRELHCAIRLYDQRGREIWRSPAMGIFPATE
jgi:hypothetical protein